MCTIKRRRESVVPGSIAALTLICLFLLGACGGGGSDGSVTPPGAQVSGNLAAGEGQVLDGDTNDPNDPATENNTPASAQIVPVPATIGGYAHRQSDEWDFYRVRLSGANTISLSVTDPAAGDLDLYLAALDGTILAGSTGSGMLEIIQTDPEQSGELLLAVQAFAGASNYLLSIGITPATATTVSSLLRDQAFLDPSADFVAGEMVVVFRDEVGDIRSQSQGSPLPQGLAQKAAAPNGARLLRIEPESALRSQAAAAIAESPLRHRSAEAQAKARTIGQIKKLRRRPDVLYAEPNYISQGFAVPNDEFFGTQWHYRMINLPQAWDMTTGSDEVVVAIIDSGVLYTHPDLAGRMLRDVAGNLIGYDFIRDPIAARDGDGIDPDPFDVGDRNNGSSSSFHGTHVAGTLAAATDNGTGVAGVTWRGKIMPIRALGAGGGNDFDLAQAILYAVGAPNVSGTVPPVRADIINLSIGTGNLACRPLPPLSQHMRDALATALDAGAMVVVAAGNDGCHVPAPLSTAPGVITVSALDGNGRLAPYSNFGPTIAVSAPGGNVLVDLDGDGLADGVMSTLADDSGLGLRFNYEINQGTSMAVPQVAGVIALMLSVNPALTSEDFLGLLAGTHPHPEAGAITRDLGAFGRDDLYGHGIIDAFIAVRQAGIIAGGGIPAPPGSAVLAVAPESLNFGLVATTLQLLISDPGTVPLEVTAITTDAPWLAIDDSGFPTVVITVDRSGLPAGASLGAILIESNGGNRTVPVAVRGREDATGGDVGTAYVLVLDATTMTTVAQATTSARLGYAFQLADLPAGEYFVVAGSDRDNDGFICESGEACDVYPLTDHPEPIRLDGPVGGIDFPISFSFAILTEPATSSLQLWPEPGFQRLDVQGEQ